MTDNLAYKEHMMHMPKADLVEYFISEVDQLEPENTHYEHYFAQMIKDRVSVLYDDAREGLLEEMKFMDVCDIVDFMIEHRFCIAPRRPISPESVDSQHTK